MGEIPDWPTAIVYIVIAICATWLVAKLIDW